MSGARDIILHIREANIWGSPERLILGQVRFLTDYQCVPVTYRRRGQSNPFAERLGQEDVDCAEIDETGPGDLLTISRLVKVIRQKQARLIVTHDFKSDLYGYIASKITGCPQIVHFHGFTAEGAKVRFYNAIDRAVMRRCRAIVTVAEQTRETLVSLGVDAAKIEVVINAVAPEAFETITEEGASVSADRKRIVAAGRLSHEKGFDLLVQAGALLKERGLKCDVQIYGDGPEKTALAEQINGLRISDRIGLAGFKSDLRPVYAQAEFLVIPSRSEAFPLVVLEAWAQGTPTVATPVGRLPELIDHGVNGLLAADVTPEALTDAITTALQTPDFRQRCGAAGRELVKQKYVFANQVTHLKEIYDRFIHGAEAE